MFTLYMISKISKIYPKINKGYPSYNTNKIETIAISPDAQKQAKKQMIRQKKQKIPQRKTFQFHEAIQSPESFEEGAIGSYARSAVGLGPPGATSGVMDIPINVVIA